MIRLSEWFQSNTRRPLAIAAALVLALGVSVTVKSYFEIEEAQRNGFRQLLEVTSLAISQKNRILLESILQSAQTQAHAQLVAICEDDRTLMSSSQTTDVCNGEKRLLTRIFMEPIPGVARHRLVMVFPLVVLAGNQIYLVCISFLLMAVTLSYDGRLKGTFAVQCRSVASVDRR